MGMHVAWWSPTHNTGIMGLVLRIGEGGISGWSICLTLSFHFCDIVVWTCMQAGLSNWVAFMWIQSPTESNPKLPHICIGVLHLEFDILGNLITPWHLASSMGRHARMDIIHYQLNELFEAGSTLLREHQHHHLLFPQEKKQSYIQIT